MTTQDSIKEKKLTDITPKILDLLEKAEHKIGYSDHEGDEYEYNNFYFDEAGWDIDITYRCCGKWSEDFGDYWNPPSCEIIRAWGDVTDISASYHDEETDDDYRFYEEDLQELRSKIDEILKSIAC